MPLSVRRKHNPFRLYKVTASDFEMWYGYKFPFRTIPIKFYTIIDSLSEGLKYMEEDLFWERLD